MSMPNNYNDLNAIKNKNRKSTNICQYIQIQLITWCKVPKMGAKWGFYHVKIQLKLCQFK